MPRAKRIIQRDKQLIVELPQQHQPA